MKNIKWKFKGKDKLPFFDLHELSMLDWLIALALLAVLFVTFVEGDIILTGNRSFLYYTNGFFKDFYKASYEQSQGFYANYLPSTFIAFAIWNLPLYLLGRVPAEILTMSFVNLMWYKLLPVILYFVTSHFLYKICMELGFEEKKAKLCQFAFIVCPIGVYSQFIFSQYDIFMIFFMVWGLYHFFKEDMFRFALLFGIAATFKYQALAYFALLLVLREKRFRQLILYVLTAAAPLAIAVLPYIRSPYFYRCVIGFHALSFGDNGFEFGFISGISLMLAVAAYLMVWAYTRRIPGRDEFNTWALFLSNGVSFAIFGFSRWNPQWFIVMVPFLILTIFLNRHGKTLLLIMNIFTVALYIFSVNQWQGIADQMMLKPGIFKRLLEDKPFATTMADVYPYNNMVTLATCIFIILLVYFVFNHPKYLSLRRSEILPYMINYIRVAFLVGVFAFVIPAGVSMIHAVRGDMIFANNTSIEAEDCYTVNITSEAPIRQTFMADGDTVTDISIRLGMHNRINDADMHIRILEKSSGREIYSDTISMLHMVREESMYSVVGEKVPVESGKEYVLEISGSGDASNCVAAYYVDVDNSVNETAEIPGDEDDRNQIIMKIRGIQK